MIPPTSIDGTDITGATIDGTDVTEITVDGQTVFSAGPGLNEIVAPSNLVAWFPMEAGTALDETRTGGVLDNAGIAVGDSTDYSGSVQNATHLSSGGAFDLDTGANSGVFNFDGTGDLLTTGVFETQPVTFMAWARFDGASLGNDNYIFDQDENRFSINTGRNGRVGMEVRIFDGSFKNISTNNTAPSLTHFAATVASSGTMEFFINGTSQGSISTSGFAVVNTSRHLTIGHSFSDIGTNNSGGWNGLIDDVRVYNTDLSQTQINQIYQNTDPN